MTRFVLLSPAARAARSAPLMVGAALAALVVLAPLVSLALHALGADVAHWAHLVDYVLPQALANTAWLLLGVGLVVTLLGTGTAWLVTAYDLSLIHI